MGCVNKSSSEFKKLAARYNLDSNGLELIVHKYWLETGNETIFPTDTYIQAQLGNMEYQESGKSVRKLWKQRYSSPKEFNTYEDMRVAYKEATRFFPESAITYYATGKNKYMLIVKKPVEKLTKDKKSFFKKLDTMEGSRTLDLGIKEHENYSINKVQELFDRFNTDRTSKDLASKVFGIAKEIGLNIVFENLQGKKGEYSNTNTVRFSKLFLEHDNRNDLKAPVLLHEVIHAISMYALSDQTSNWKRPKDLEAFRKEINSIFNELKDNSALRGQRGILDVKEFLAELSNPAFRAKLQDIDKADKEKNAKKSFWQKILDAFKSLLGIHPTSRYYERSMNALDKAISAFDVDSYMVYNRMKNPLREEYHKYGWDINSIPNERLKEEVINAFDKKLYDQEMLSVKQAAIANGTFMKAPNGKDTKLTEKQWLQVRTKNFKERFGDWKNNPESASEVVDENNSGEFSPIHDEIANYEDSDTTKDFLDSLSEGEVKKELSLMKQEEADYDTLFAIDSNKKSERTGPQKFTFEDGTTLDVPFKPNDQQVGALNAMDAFIKSDKNVMTFSGYAGTGKTSLMEIIARKANLDGERVAFCASTNKAAAILDSKVSRLGFKATTLNKLFGISVEADMGSKVYDANKLRTVLKDADIDSGTTVIIDEASMIGKENYDIINDIAKAFDLKIIYVGDPAQLPPVNEKEISPVFRSNEGEMVTLTQVERTDDNAILKEATAIRNGEHLSGESSFNAKGEGVAYVSSTNKETIDDIINHYAPELSHNPNYFRVLAYTNAAISEYNSKVREALGYTSSMPKVGEPMMAYANFGYNKLTRSYDIINSESYKVVESGDPKTISRRTKDGHTMYMEVIPLILEDSFGKRVKVNYMDVKNNALNRETAYALAKEKSALWSAYHTTRNKNFLKDIEDIDKFLFINDNLMDKEHSERTLQKKAIDFGYALTIHKSQGSTFTHVLLDDVDIATHTRRNTPVFESMDLFDASDEKAEDFDNAVMTSSEDLDLFSGMDFDSSEEEVKPEPSKPQQQEVNLRQQLEYVGVSRATDTVTVISNSIKKEDSPLKHIDNTATMTTNQLVNKVQHDSQKLYLTSDGKYYTNESGEKFARVTSVITTDADRFDPNSPWGTPSSAIGNGVDIFFRDFFDGEIGNPNDLASRYPNADQQHLRELYNKLVEIKETLKGKKITVVPKDVTLSGHITVTDKNGKKYNVNIAGTVDLLLYDGEGNFYIYDMKTHRSNHPIDQNASKLNRYTKQVSLYKTLFEQQYPGHPVKGLALLPIHVEYPAPKGWNNATAEYTADKYTNQLYLNGTEYRGANPVLEKTIGVTPQSVEIKYEDLSDDIKAIATPVEDSPAIKPDNQRSTTEQPKDWSTVTKELIDHLRGMQLNVFGRDAMQQYFKEHPNSFVQQAIFGVDVFYLNKEHLNEIPELQEIVESKKYNKAGTDAVTLESEGHQYIYLIDHSNAEEYAAHRKEGRHGLGIRDVFDINKLTKDDCRTIIRNIAGDYRRSEVYIRRKLQDLGIRPEHLSGIDIATELKMGTNANDSLVSSRKGKRVSTDNNRNSINGRESEKGSRQKNRIGNDGVEYFLTPNGEVYGFVDKNNNIYLDETKISPEHPLHEFSHIWDRAVMKKNPELWRRGVELMKQTSLWNEILNDDNYGKKWQSLSNMPQSRLDSLIASEVHSRLVGKEGQQIIEKLSKEKGQKDIIGKLKQWLLDFWKDLKSAFAPWSKDDLDKLTLDDFNHMTIKDFAEGINPLKAEVSRSSNLPTAATVFTTSGNNYYQGRTKENADWSDVTMALAENFGTAGEKLTRRVAGDKYVYSGLLNNSASQIVDNLYKQLIAKGKTKNIKLNIAGNGIYGMKEDQGYYNDLVTQVLKGLQDKGITISAVRSEGQSGIDEAGIIAAQRLGIPNEVHTTANYMFRDKSGRDIADEKAFKDRFAQDQKNFKAVTETHNEIKRALGNDSNAESEIKDTLKTAVKGISFKDALQGVESVFTKEEQSQIESALGGKPLRVMSVSRRTDPIFFTKEIIERLKANADKPFTDSSRMNAIEIWTKHDGLPMRELMEACKKYKVAPMVSFSITTLGNTSLEKGVLKYEDLLDRIETFIKQDIINPKTTTIRIDPILPGVTNMEDIKKVVERAKGMGIKKFVTSLVQSYGYTVGTPNDRKVISGIDKAMAEEGKTYDWDKYYGRGHRGEINFNPKQEYIDEIGKALIELNKDPEIEIETCSFNIKGLAPSACLDPFILERIIGISVHHKDGTYDRDTSRPWCMCYGAHSDMFRWNEKKCFSSCAYCYAGKSDNPAISYYNEDGTLKDNKFTRTSEELPKSTTLPSTAPSSPASWATKSDNGYEVSSKGDKRFSALNAAFGDNTTVNGIDVSGRTIEDAYQTLFKKSRKGQPPAEHSLLNVHSAAGYYEGGGRRLTDEFHEVPQELSDKLADYFWDKKPLSKQDYEDFSYYAGYLPLWKEWAKQNSDLIEDLREKSKGKVLTDMFSNTTVNQARALSDILNESSNTVNTANGTEVKDTPASLSTLPEAEKQQLPLPNYQDYNNLNEDVTIDAEWKAQYLKELDSQITDDMPQGDKDNIIKQMDKVLQATTEKAYLEDLNNPNKKKTEEVLDEYDKLNKQIDNLLEGGEKRWKEFTELGVNLVLSATEIRHTAELIVNSISDEITKIQNEGKEYVENTYPGISTEKDFSNMTRKEIVETVGINSLIDRAKTLFDSENAVYEDMGIAEQADLITENWDAMMLLASDAFAFNEGFGIKRDYEKSKWDTTQSSEPQQADADDFNSYHDKDKQEEEGSRDEQEKWQMDSMTIDVLNSMSALVRQGLHECYLLDSEGNHVKSKWGIDERVNPREATNSILRWTQGAKNLEEMISRLSEKQEKNPWVSQLITRLSDTSGANTDFQSQFYGVFQKHFQPYCIVKMENGKYYSMEVNRHPALKEAMDTIRAQYQAGENALLGTDSSINIKLLGTDNTTGKDDDFNLHKALHEIAEVRDALRNNKELDADMAKVVSENVQGVCRIFNYPITEDMIAETVNKENINNWAYYLDLMIKDLDGAYNAIKDKKLDNYEPFGYYKDYNIRNSLSKFLTPAVEPLEDIAVNAFYDSGKMYQSYVTPSFLSTLFNKFHQEGKDFTDFMMKNYGQSEWFAVDDDGRDYTLTEFERKNWRNVWLDRLVRDPKAREIFDHKVELNFNKHNYMRNMTDAEYTLSLFAEYFAENTDAINNDFAPAWFRVPMQSNKPSSDFIRFYSYRGDHYKKQIIKGLHMMFMQELSRIQTVNMRNLSKDDSAFIKNFDTNGKKFNFLPILNAYLENTEKAKAEREDLIKGVSYNEDRLEELEARHKAYQEQVVNTNSDNAVDGEFIDFEKLAENDQKLESLKLTEDEYSELLALRQKRDSNKSAITSEENSRFAELLQEKVKGERQLTTEEEAELGTLADKIITQSMENRVQSILDAWEKDGILEAAKSIKDIYPKYLEGSESAIKNHVRKQIENFLWNDSFASKNILQLTIGDIAFYKDAEDLQKRLAQLHAPGIRANVNAVDYNGERVSDGKYRTVILKDFDTFISNIIDNISEVFDRKITAAANGTDKATLTALKESLVGKDGAYRTINVTDAQGYSSPTSYRKKAFMFGRWSKKAEEVYQNIKDNPSITDLEVAFQPLKPFVYSMLEKNMGVDNAPITKEYVPFQAKNAEYLLIMADALLQGEKTSRPNLLRAVYRIMEESAFDGRTYNADGTVNNPGKYNGKGIDTIQFESAIKSGLQGAMDIAQFLNKANGEDAAYAFMKEQIYKHEVNENTNERLYLNYNTDTFVHETSFDGYCIQQEVPEHFKEHSQAHGSQIRMIIPSDLDFYTTDAEGNQVENYYTWKEPNGEVKKLKADEFKKEYEETIAAQIEDSINTLSEELHLNSGSIKERNLALSKILQREIISSPRYGIDLMQACQVDKETGEFRIPMGDPIQAKRIEQLINSIIKNRINKQKIAGGPIVQVSNFGTSQQLHIRFNDKEGNLMPLKEEYNPAEHDNLSYEDYCKKNQGGIAYFEVFAPIWSDEIQEKFGNPDGSINMAAIEATDPEMLKMVSYRIPTEDKYSCAPMKIVGFMPRIAGDAIMLPSELTTIDDSDFDVDKRYVMRKDNGPIFERLPLQIEKIMFEKLSADYKLKHNGESNDDFIKEKVHQFIYSPKSFKVEETPLLRAMQKLYQQVAYYTVPPKKGRKYRDNKIVDMTMAVLTNEMTADKILNPGGFDAPKKTAYKIAAYRETEGKHRWKDLDDMSTEDLKKLCYTEKDLTFADTQVQFYKQNAAASSLIGVFAVNKVAHAVLESNDIYLNVSSSNLCGEEPFTIADTTFGGKMQIDKKYDSQGNLIGKTLGSLVSASADAVKDPILNLMNVNMTTAGMLNTMLRLGMPFDDAALFLSQDVITRLLNQFNRENLNGYSSLNSIISKWIDHYNKKHGYDRDSVIAEQPIDREELVEGIAPGEHNEIDYKVLIAFQKLRLLTDAMRKITFATRFNSISSAVGPLVIDNLIIERKMNEFKDGGEENTTDFYTADGSNVDIDDVFYDHPVLAQFARTVDIAKTLLSKMPANSTQFRQMLGLESIGNADAETTAEVYPDVMPKSITDKMFGDKKLLDQFSNFYQSYMLIQTGVVNPADFKYFIEKFPLEFVKKDYAKKYPDNALIQAIRMNVSKRSNRPYLKINITGMDEAKKEELRSAWIDLHKADPELSKQLFDYSFFVAGIGFSPKTFMALVPGYVKERLKSKEGSSTYVDTYRNFPTIVPSLVIDQFIRNNWNNNKLVPKKGGKDTRYTVDLNHGRLEVYRKEDIKDLAGVPYMKTRMKGTDYLWHLVSSSKSQLVYERVEPLGNNGEYLEMSLEGIQKSLNETLQTSEDEAASPMKESSAEETDSSEATTPIITDSEKSKKIAELLSDIQKQNKGTAEKAKEIYEKAKVNPKLYAGFLQNLFKEQRGLEFDKDQTLKYFKRFC